jgi:hypothetical protein
VQNLEATMNDESKDAQTSERAEVKLSESSAVRDWCAGLGCTEAELAARVAARVRIRRRPFIYEDPGLPGS